MSVKNYPHLMDELAYKFKHGKSYHERRIAGKAKDTIEQQRSDIEALHANVLRLRGLIRDMEDKS